MLLTLVRCFLLQLLRFFKALHKSFLTRFVDLSFYLFEDGLNFPFPVDCYLVYELLVFVNTSPLMPLNVYLHKHVTIAGLLEDKGSVVNLVYNGTPLVIYAWLSVFQCYTG